MALVPATRSAASLSAQASLLRCAVNAAPGSVEPGALHQEPSQPLCEDGTDAADSDGTTVLSESDAGSSEAVAAEVAGSLDVGSFSSADVTATSRSGGCCGSTLPLRRPDQAHSRQEGGVAFGLTSEGVAPSAAAAGSALTPTRDLL